MLLLGFFRFAAYHEQERYNPKSFLERKADCLGGLNAWQSRHER